MAVWLFIAEGKRNKKQGYLGEAEGEKPGKYDRSNILGSRIS